jgi:hypothetical protein
LAFAGLCDRWTDPHGELRALHDPYHHSQQGNAFPQRQNKSIRLKKKSNCKIEDLAMGA